MKNTWFEKHLMNGKSSLPFSFTYDGRPSAPLLAKWPSKVADERFDASRTQHTLTWTDPQTGLEVRCVAVDYADSPAVEWTVWFKNTGTADTPILENVLALDMANEVAQNAQPRISYSKGTKAVIDDFALEERLLPAGQATELASCGSRQVLPFFNLDLGGRGVIGAVGWTGNWKCTIQRSGDGAGVRLCAGMSRTHLRLHPGEEIRTPRILILSWEGERERGHHLLRRHLVTHHLPKVNGRTVEPPICSTSWGGMKTHNHLKNIQFIREHRLPFNCYWIDACWYGPDHETDEFQNLCNDVFPHHIGNWRVNRTVHPRGLKPIADAAHAAGMKLLLWFAPYGAVADSPLVKEHPEWLEGLSASFNSAVLREKPHAPQNINIGIPEARQYLLDYISATLAENGVDYFRDDWVVPIGDGSGDAPDRQGMTEIRGVEGFYAFWDELLRRHPGMLIDNCGGGGTRIDLETISRSLVLWRSDYNCHPHADPIGMQAGTHGLAHWVPLVGGGAPARPGDTYNFRSSWSGGIPFGLFHPVGLGHAPLAPAPDYPVEWHRRMIKEYRRALPYYTGDYYALTSCSTAPKDWFAYQLDRPDLGGGLILAFRRAQCVEAAQTFFLRGLDPAARYEVTNLDAGGSPMSVSGRDLMAKGMTVEIRDQAFEKMPPDDCLDIALPGEGVAFGPFTREAGVPSTEALRQVPAEVALGGVRARGRTFAFRDRVMDLASLLKADGEVAFVYLPFNAPESGRAVFGVGADWWYEAYLDGVVISETFSNGILGNVTNPPTIRDRMVLRELSKGEHLLVLRFVRGHDSALLAVGAGPRDLRDERITAPGSALIQYRREEKKK
ncbi:MAG: alpha-galactosidase [Lentisphaerae bacterium]|nr:alpha-galactosidase [Lentisphaerota bacterium]